MKLAFLSDIHANLPALEACLAGAEALGAERFVFLGDFVGYGPDPEAVVRRVRPLVEAGAIAVLGNHDEATFHPDGRMNSAAAAAMEWTRQHLSPESVSFLKSLPLEVNDGSHLFVHADGSNPSAWNYVTDAEMAGRSLAAVKASVTFCGHVHMPALYCTTQAGGKVTAHTPSTDITIPLASHRHWLAVLGAVGQPRDGNPAASFAVYNSAVRSLTYHRAPYDAEGVARRILDAGLPESLAARLVKGR
ncbi:MAG: metallophosphoesterase family protein [Rhizobiales bacterium]|nr:metallophosphoesterase family protein [Hyphomicrobiales bacterium]